MSLALTWCYDNGGSIWSPIALHMVLNALILASAVLGRREGPPRRPRAPQGSPLRLFPRLERRRFFVGTNLPIPRFAVYGKARSFRCASSPHRTRFAGFGGGPHFPFLESRCFYAPHSAIRSPRGRSDRRRRGGGAARVGGQGAHGERYRRRGGRPDRGDPARRHEPHPGYRQRLRHRRRRGGDRLSPPRHQQTAHRVRSGAIGTLGSGGRLWRPSPPSPASSCSPARRRRIWGPPSPWRGARWCTGKRPAAPRAPQWWCATCSTTPPPGSSS